MSNQERGADRLSPPSEYSLFSTLFTLNPNGSEISVLLEFDRHTTGAFPSAGLIQGPDGALYGTTAHGEEHDAGTIFRLSWPGSLASLNPATALANGPCFMLNLIGANFKPGSTVLWNGVPVPGTFTSSSQLGCAKVG